MNTDGDINDGNTARRFFENSAVSASITGLNECLIKRFHVILQVISSDHEINYNKFQEYGVETAKKFIELYPWYYIPISVHKLLIHGSQVIVHAMHCYQSVNYPKMLETKISKDIVKTSREIQEPKQWKIFSIGSW